MGEDTNRRKNIYLYKETNTFLNESGILDLITFGQLVNFSLKNTMPEILEELKTNNPTLLKFARILKQEAKRNMILKIRREEKSKYYFLSRFFQEWRKLLDKPYPNDKLKKSRLLKILTIYINESETYLDNEEITLKLKRYRNSIMKSVADVKTIKDLFDITLIQFNIKENESYYEHIGASPKNKIEEDIEINIK